MGFESQQKSLKGYLEATGTTGASCVVYVLVPDHESYVQD